jgi:ferredoxin
MPADRVPGDPATLVMVGNAGPDMWAAFDGVRDAYADGANPLDAWITDVLDAVAADIGATALFPFGVLIHPEFGLWHAYRGALAFPEKLELAQADTHPSPCDSCADRPCLSACPVGAFASATYDVPACVGHIMGPDSGDCMGQGCQARRACPIGRAYVYTPDQAGFHMRAFTGAQDGN